MNVQIEESWKAHLQPEFEKDYFRTLTDFVRDEYGKYAIYPPGKRTDGAYLNRGARVVLRTIILNQHKFF